MLSILLIDDERDVRDSVKKILEKSGYSVFSASNATEGIASAEAQEFDIVITDIIMPGVNGVDLIKQMRKLMPKVRILAISGGGNFRPAEYRPEAITTTAYLQAALKAGADGILTKPFEKSELLESVRALNNN
jgi:YesN/AraC family two-component response regulator